MTSQKVLGYYIDIQRDLNVEDEDGESSIDTVDTLTLYLGSGFGASTKIYTVLSEENLMISGLRYIRFRYQFGIKMEENVVLSRITPSGVGDW